MSDRFQVDPEQLPDITRRLAESASELQTMQRLLAELQRRANQPFMPPSAQASIASAQRSTSSAAADLQALGTDVRSRHQLLLSIDTPIPGLGLTIDGLHAQAAPAVAAPTIDLGPSIDTGGSSDWSALLAMLLAALAAAAAGAAAAGGGSDAARRIADGLGILFAKGGKKNEAPQQLSPEEEKALADKAAGRPYDRRAYNSARQKQIQAEKYRQQRNKQKRQSN